MGFRTGSWAKVWEVRPTKSSGVTELRISISKKNRDTGEYEQDFGGYVRCAGTACAAKASALKEGDRIRLGDVDVTRRYDKEAQKEYLNFTVFSFDVDDGMGSSGSSAASTAPAPRPSPSEPAAPEGDSDDELPF